MGFDDRKAAEAVAEACQSLIRALDDLLEVQKELLGLDPDKADWEDWQRLIGAVEQAEHFWLEHAKRDIETLKQQLEELRKEISKRNLARHGIKVED
jgi:hypothetical protein